MSSGLKLELNTDITDFGWGVEFLEFRRLIIVRCEILQMVDNTRLKTYVAFYVSFQAHCLTFGPEENDKMITK